jgi:branched-chain amino acid aminotransferase
LNQPNEITNRSSSLIEPTADGASGADEVPAYKRGFACVDGEFIPAAEATVSIFDHSFLYGDGAFESVVCRGGRPYALWPHLDRLAASCLYLQIPLPFTHEELESQIEELLTRNSVDKGYIRVVVSRGEGYPVSDPRRAIKTKVVVSVQGVPYAVREPGVGVKLAIASTRRIPSICLEPRVKSNNYLNHIVAKLEAIAAGADDALMLDIDGNVAELPVANVFALHGDLLSTPPANGILAGITRRTVMELLEDADVAQGVRVVERIMNPYDLYTAEELFVVGTGTSVAHVESVDGRLIRDGGIGPLTARIAAHYERVLDGEITVPASNGRARR